jgi:hypothetical protein
MKLFNESNLKAIADADLDTLVLFDDHGLLIGANETVEDYLERIKTLNRNVSEFCQELGKEESVEFFTTRLQKADEIPDEIFRAVQNQTRELYDFAIDWVPGFYSNYQMGILFAGCAYYSYEDFFAVFVIRKAFRDKAKWLIYGRDELMAHELCHIARIGFDSVDFEEMFAYQTSTSSFRRLVGGLLRTPGETYVLMGSVFALLIAQVVNIATRPAESWWNMPMPAIFAAVIAVLAVIGLRYVHSYRQWRRAGKLLGEMYSDRSGAVLFRCSDDEVRQVARLADATALGDWIGKRSEDDIRWRLIERKFGA